MKVTMIVLLSVLFATNLYAKKPVSFSERFGRNLVECYASVTAPNPKADEVADRLRKQGLLDETYFAAGSSVVKISSIFQSGDFEPKQLDWTKQRLEKLKSDFMEKGIEIDYEILGCRSTELNVPSKIDPPRAANPKKGNVIPASNTSK